MANTDLVTVAGRAASVCASAPFAFTQTKDPFTFELQPTGVLDTVFRIEAALTSVNSGSNYSEVQIGQLRIFLARKQKAAPQTAYRQLLTDAHSLTAAIVRDGVTGGGDYDVPDQGRGISVQHDTGKEFAVLRLTVPVNYEAQL